MRIAILQLARLGDILQTLPAIQGLKKKYPNSEITLVVRQKFSDAARVSPHVDKIVELPTALILEPALTAQNQAESLARLAHWIGSELIADGPYHKLINLTFTRASSYLAGLVPANEKLGVKSTKAGAHIISDPWSQYFFSQVLNHNMNMIHLNDLFSRICGVEKTTWPIDVRQPNEAAAIPPKTERMRIGIQVTASVPEKTLNSESWSAVCKQLLARFPTAELVFFGGQGDLTAIAAVASTLPIGSYTTLAGTLKFNENVAWVRACSHVVSPDTALVHLASLCGTKVVELAIGAVRPEETGPYGEDHHVLYPVSCNAMQLGEQVARAIAGEKASTVVAQSQTRMVKCSHGALRSELAAKNFTPEESRNFFQKAYYLLAEFRCAGRVEDIDIPKLGDPAQPAALDKVLAAYDAMCVVRRIAEFGQHYCVKLLQNSEDQAQLKIYAEKLSQLESMLDEAQKTVPLVKPLVDTWIVAKDLAESPGDDLETMIAVTEGAYRELGQNVEIVQQLLQTAVDAAVVSGRRPDASIKDMQRSLENKEASNSSEAKEITE